MFDGTVEAEECLKIILKKKKDEKLDGSWVRVEGKTGPARLMDGYDALSRSHDNKPYTISALCRKQTIRIGRFRSVRLIKLKYLNASVSVNYIISSYVAETVISVGLKVILEPSQFPGRFLVPSRRMFSICKGGFRRRSGRSRTPESLEKRNPRLDLSADIGLYVSEISIPFRGIYVRMERMKGGPDLHGLIAHGKKD